MRSGWDLKTGHVCEYSYGLYFVYLRMKTIYLCVVKMKYITVGVYNFSLCIWTELLFYRNISSVKMTSSVRQWLSDQIPSVVSF